MKITKISAVNFRALQNVTLELRDSLSLLIGRNNSGKTSLLVLFEKFYEPGVSFNYHDFPLAVRKDLAAIDHKTDVLPLSISMKVEVEYNQTDSLRHLSEFMLDLDSDNNNVKILFECVVNKDLLLRDIEQFDGERERFLRKNLDRYLQVNVYAYADEEDLLLENRSRLVKKEIAAVRDLINFQIIHAKRDVASSEGGKKMLSKLTTQYFNKANKNVTDFDPINNLLLKIDESLESSYKDFFEPFLKTSKAFLGIEDIKVVSNLESNEVLENSSQVVYGDRSEYLPETFNGLGHMNILYLLLSVEIKKESFAKTGKNINLLFIEEPEAHTHPQMQYIFANQIKSILNDIENIQAVITTHSSHIVSQCDFKDIRYLQSLDGCTKVKNFYSELKTKYGKDEDSFKFLEQYLTLNSCELFFASKVIFIEGVTERMLWPYFVELFDKSKVQSKDHVSLFSQNVTILEVGANAKAFKHFLDFLEIKTLVITDIDTTKKTIDTTKASPRTIYPSFKVSGADHTSNATLKHYYQAPDFSEEAKFSSWFEKLVTHKLNHSYPKIHIAYQTQEEGYRARSFEDAFVHLNRDVIKKKIDNINGLKNTHEFDGALDAYDLIETVLDKKSAFASSLLYLALTDDEVTWRIPAYIVEALEWISE
jgi:predicted ATP-dependent endonuclease of OLD family